MVSLAFPKPNSYKHNMRKSYGLFPRIRFHNNSFRASNNYYGIEINPTHPFYAAQLAQERYEFKQRWLTNLLLASPFSIAILFTSYPYLAFVPIILMMGILPKIKYFTRRREIVGHAIEALVASLYYKADYPSYLRKEASDLTNPNSSYSKKGLFNDLSTELMYEKLVNAEEDAKNWVSNHVSTIQSDMKKVS